MPGGGFTKVFENKRGLQKFVHKNGMTVIFRAKKEAESVTLGIGSRAGLVHHPLTHLNHHMLSRGTTKKSGTEIRREAGRLGDIFDALTNLYSTLLYIRVTPEHVRRGFQLLCDMIQNPAMEGDAIEKEKRVVIGEIKRWNGEPQRVLRNLIYQNLYTHHPAKDVILENSKLNAEATREQIVESHQKFYHSPQRLIVVAVGRFNPTKLLKMIEKCFGGLTKSIDNPFGVPEEENPKIRTKPIVRRWHGELAQVMFGFRTPTSHRSDYFPVRLFSAILGEGLDSRLYEELREKTGLVHVRGPLYPASEYDCSRWHGVFHIYTPCDPEDISAVTKIIRRELKKLRREPIEEEELERNKIQLNLWRKFDLMGTHKHAHLLFATEINGTLERFDDFSQLINKVTARDIQRVARKYCLPSRAVYAILKPSKKPRDT